MRSLLASICAPYWIECNLGRWPINHSAKLLGCLGKATSDKMKFLHDWDMERNTKCVIPWITHATFINQY